MSNALIGLLKSKKLWLGTGGLGLLALGRRNTDEIKALPTSQGTVLMQTKQLQPISEPKNEQKVVEEKPKVRSIKVAQKKKQKASTSEQEFNTVASSLLQLINEIQQIGTEYEATREQYVQFLRSYEAMLTDILPKLTMFMMKTPLSMITTEDLPTKIRELMLYSPYNRAIENYPKLIKGYYMAKVNNLNTKNLTAFDLVEIADNPSLASITSENLQNLAEAIGTILQMQIKNQIDLIGRLKDEAKSKLDAMKAIANIFKEISMNIYREAMLAQREEKLRFERERLMQRWAEIELKERRLKLDEEKQQSKAKSKEEPPLIQVKPSR